MSDQSAFHLHVFRVSEGLGNACLIELPDGTFGIIDWGTQHQESLEAALGIIGNQKIRFVAASHAHADHTLGLPALLKECVARKIPVDRFVYPASTLHRENAHLTAARIAARDCKIDMSSIGVESFAGPSGWPEPPCLAWGEEAEWEVLVLSPSLTRIGLSEIQALEGGVVPGNETSLVVLFRFTGDPADSGLGQALLPGDATPATLGFARETTLRSGSLQLDNQAFVVPHHGSVHNLPPWFEDYLHGVVLVSARSDSPHHPSPDILKRLSQRTCAGATPRLFCTSYADACARKFGASAQQLSLIRPGSCFGDIQVRVPRSEAAIVVSASAAGELRRRYGYCGHVS